MLFSPSWPVLTQLGIHKHTIWKDQTINSYSWCQASPKWRIRMRHFIWGCLIPSLPVTVLHAPFFDGAEIAHCWRSNPRLDSPQVWFTAVKMWCSCCSLLASGLGCFPTLLLPDTISCGEHPQNKPRLFALSLLAKTYWLVFVFTHNWDNNVIFDFW